MVKIRHMRYIIVVLGMFITVFTSCNNKKLSFGVIVEQVKRFDSIPSGSGIVVYGDSVFVMGDDATSLYKVSLLTGAFEAIPLIHTDQTRYRISKPDKHDLESLSIITFRNKKYIAAFGSGSISPQRDSLLLVSLDDHRQQEWISLGSFYTVLRHQSLKREMNIEGFVSTTNSIYLFNRSGSEVYDFPISMLEAILNPKDSLNNIEIKRHQFKLPTSAGVQSALSGGCLLDDNTILFCASSENLPNVYDDGDIQGSYVGMISIGQNGLILKELVEIKDKTGAVLKDKLESIDLAGRYRNGDIRAFAIADNDDGRSKLLELRIILNK